jgi:DNA-binding protein Fis
LENILKISGICSVISQVLDNFFLIQKNVDDVSGLYWFVMREVECALIKKTFQLTDRNKKRTAKILGISRNTLNTKMKILKIDAQ